MRRFFGMLAVMVFMAATCAFAQQSVHQATVPAGFSGSSGGGGGKSSAETPDSERVAQTFAGHKIKEFKDAGYAFARYENGRFSEWVQAQFEMTNKGRISYLVINGVVIVRRGDPPLDGLPPNARGEARDFHLWMSAYDEGNRRIAEGSFSKSLWLPRDPISVKLDPVDIHVLVLFTVPDGVDPKNLRLQIHDEYNSSFMYNESTHGFDVWMDPLMPMEYEIIDVSTRIVYGRGTLDTLATTPVQQSNVSVVSVLLPEGVVEVLFDERGYALYERQTFSGHVMREKNCPIPIPGPNTPIVKCDEDEVPAKVYFTDLNRAGLFIGVFSDNPNDRFVIEIRRWQEKGEMPLIARTHEVCILEKCPTYLQIGPGYEQVVITILPADPKNPAPNFYVSLFKH